MFVTIAGFKSEVFPFEGQEVNVPNQRLKHNPLMIETPLFSQINTVQMIFNQVPLWTVLYRGRWGNAGPLSISPYKYNTNHGNSEQSSSLSRIGHIVTSNMSTVTLDP